MMVDKRLPRRSPEAEGVSSARLLAFVEAVDETIRDMHSFMLLRHGRVLAAGWWHPYAPDLPHTLFSLSKSFTAIAVGLAVAGGRLSVADRVISLLPDDCPEEVSDGLAALRVRHLLTMTAGFDPQTTYFMFADPDGNWARGTLGRPLSHEPGRHFYYDDGAPYLLSAIVQRLTGMPILDTLRQRLFAPLGVEVASWSQCPRGINSGFTGLSLTTEAVARFGQLLLNKGTWFGKRPLAENWVEQATRFQVANGSNPDADDEQGYGYLFWRYRYNAYGGDGAFGQFCQVWPDHEVVLAITAGKEGMQDIQDLLWEHVLPAIAAAPLPENQPAERALQRKLADLTLPPPHGRSHSPWMTRLRNLRFDLRGSSDSTAA